jgi:glycosyltransferase involved in cell wall biosynthesis
MAVGVPFVLSPVGACQEIAESNQTHFIARTADEWYAHLSRLLRDEDLRRQLGESGRRYAEKHYSIEAHVPKLAEALRSAKQAADFRR